MSAAVKATSDPRFPRWLFWLAGIAAVLWLLQKVMP